VGIVSVAEHFTKECSRESACSKCLNYGTLADSPGPAQAAAHRKVREKRTVRRDENAADRSGVRSTLEAAFANPREDKSARLQVPAGTLKAYAMPAKLPAPQAVGATGFEPATS